MQSENAFSQRFRKAADFIRLGFVSARIFGYNMAEKFNGKSKSKTIESALKEMPADRLFRLLEFSRKKNALLEEKLKLLSSNKPKCVHENSVAVINTNGNHVNSIKDIKQKFPRFPEEQLERIDMERQIARFLSSTNGGTFRMSQVLQAVEKLYPADVKPTTRIMIFNEIKSWINRDSLVRQVKSSDSVTHYAFI